MIRSLLERVGLVSPVVPARGPVFWRYIPSSPYGPEARYEVICDGKLLYSHYSQRVAIEHCESLNAHPEWPLR